MAEQSAKPLPAVDFLKIPENGEPYLEGHKCQCGAIFLGARSICSKCGARGKIAATRLSNRGKLYVYSIVFRSFPGIQTPYVSAIVDLDGGGTLTVLQQNLESTVDQMLAFRGEAVVLSWHPTSVVTLAEEPPGEHQDDVPPTKEFA